MPDNLINKINTLKYEHIYNPLMHSYSKSKLNDNILKKELELMTLKEIKNIHVIKLKHKDYILFNSDFWKNYDDYILNLTKDWNNIANGQIIYFDNKNNFLEYKNQYNSLIITKNRTNIKKYIKYINNNEKREKILIKLEF